MLIVIRVVWDQWRWQEGKVGLQKIDFSILLLSNIWKNYFNSSICVSLNIVISSSLSLSLGTSSVEFYCRHEVQLHTIKKSWVVCILLVTYLKHTFHLQIKPHKQLSYTLQTVWKCFEFDLTELMHDSWSRSKRLLVGGCMLWYILHLVYVINNRQFYGH